MSIATISEETYQRERAICDAHNEWARQFEQANGWTVIPADAKAPGDAALCDNDMRGRVEQFEILHDLPDVIFAYLAAPEGGCYPVTVWTGLKIGNARRGETWNCGRGCVLAQFSARIGEREYTGRGQGAGMCIRLKETAASKRKRESA